MTEIVFYKEDIGNHAILLNSVAPDEEVIEDEECNKVWKMNFDGAHSQSGA
jgi:hypothetical protein